MKVKAELYAPIELGRRGENQARVVEFDCSAWVKEHGDGTIVLLAQRNGEGAPYPVFTERDGSTVRWTVNSADTARPGFGKAELQLVIGDKVVKSGTYSTLTQVALDDPAEETPEPFEEWTAAMAKTVARMEEAASACKVFVAEYGKTTFSQLVAAWDGGYVLFCKDGVYIYPLYKKGDTSIQFRLNSQTSALCAWCNSGSGWGKETVKHPGNHADTHKPNGSDPLILKPEDIGAVPGYVGGLNKGEDMDDYTVDGNYNVAASVAASIANAPFATSFFFTVRNFSAAKDRTVQEAFNTKGTQRKWRVKASTGWTPWQEG